MKVILLSFFAFLLGSIPTGVVIAKARGVDIKKIGSGNIGATNVLRTMGKLPALLTLLGDLLKGAIAVMVARYFETGIFFEGIIGFCSILGHDFSVFLKFRGGKGVATSLGMLCIYSPQTGIFTIIIWLMTVLITRYSSLGALLSFVAAPFIVVFLDTKEKLPIILLITILLFIRHKDNINRLFKGTESKIGKKK